MTTDFDWHTVGYTTAEGIAAALVGAPRPEEPEPRRYPHPVVVDPADLKRSTPAFSPIYVPSDIAPGELDRPPASCPECHLALPGSGVCGWCE